jgi:hypothetical protein
MGGADYWQQEQLEQERRQVLLAILQKARVARRDGYFTDTDLQDMRREFGLTKEADNEIQG